MSKETDIKEAEKEVRKAKKKVNQLFLRLSLQEQILFAKRLAILVKASVPIVSALEMLKSQASRSGIKILEQMILDVSNGQFLHTSMKQFDRIFSDLAVNIIRIGETSGTLPENLEYLATELQKKQELRRKVIGSLIYPVIIVLATLAVTIMLVVYVFPRVLPIFASLDFELPWTTKLLITVSDLLLHHGLIILGALVSLGILTYLISRIKAVRFWLHRTILELPIFGRLAQSYQMANFCRTLGLLLRSDVMIVDAAKITAGTSTNLAYERELETIAERIRKGGKMSSYMQDRKRLFPAIVPQMIGVGESSGKLSDTLAFLADLYEHEVDELTKNLSNLIEPVLMITMGLVVGFIAVSIITPIYEITQNIHP